MILDTIESHPKIQTVVIANAMRKLFAFPTDDSMDYPVSQSQMVIALEAFDAAVSELVQHNVTVYLLVDNPTLPATEDCIGRATSVPAINAFMRLPHIPTGCSLTYANYQHLSERYRLLLQQVAERHKGSVHVIETSDIYCDIQANICPIARDHTRLYGLSDHASYYSANLIAARVNQLLDLPEHDRRLASTR
jgi:SGNH domain (fused to AT3 domains)